MNTQVISQVIRENEVILEIDTNFSKMVNYSIDDL